jgi:hypothetical protein
MAPKKLTEDEAEEIRIDLREGVPISGIAKEWNISVKLVQQINYGKRYLLEGYHYPVRVLRKMTLNDRLSMAGDDED